MLSECHSQLEPRGPVGHIYIYIYIYKCYQKCHSQLEPRGPVGHK